MERKVELPIIQKKDAGKNLCIDCLVDTERTLSGEDLGKVGEGDSLWYKTWKAETAKLEEVLAKYSPRNVLEVGSGTGRVISTVLQSVPGVQITGLELDPAMYDFVNQRFAGDERVRIVNQDVANYLSNGGHYDLALCMMNTFGNINSSEVFRRIIGHSGRFVFSLYNSEFNLQRASMYRARGHEDFEFSDGKYHFNDFWVRGLTSKGYSESEIMALVKESGGEVFELDKIGILHFIVAGLGTKENSHNSW